ncbi:MAG TPA: pilin [Candidatus Paceibacterota bacterium]|nr:pilin [Candidatus Paceibacterota bacterium]
MKKLLVLIALVVLLVPIGALAQSDANCEGGFCALTNIKNVEFASNAAELPDFLNALYMICIGLAAVIGVLQIMRAGVTWMTAAGSHEKIGDAKKLVRDTIIGLVLVLAPTIVFGIINPKILSLEIGCLEGLKKGAVDCAGNVKTPEATPGSSGPVCGDYRKKQVVPGNMVCSAKNGYSKINNDCCGDVPEGSQCCGNPYGPDNPPPSMIPNTIGTDKPEPNPACRVTYKDGNLLPDGDQAQQFCCDYQDAYGIQCTALKNPRGAGLYCSCQ